MNTRKKGAMGEEWAARQLEKRGIKIICRNYTSPFGEVDLIGLEGGVLVFFEVKSWSTFSMDSLEMSINQKKRNKIIKTALCFINAHKIFELYTYRFDVVFIGYNVFKVIQGAFTETGI